MQELNAQLFDRRSWLVAADPKMGKYLTTSIAYRGKLSMRDSTSARSNDEFNTTGIG